MGRAVSVQQLWKDTGSERSPQVALAGAPPFPRLLFWFLLHAQVGLHRRGQFRNMESPALATEPDMAGLLNEVPVRHARIGSRRRAAASSAAPGSRRWRRGVVIGD